jgi:hypothetical protein
VYCVTISHKAPPTDVLRNSHAHTLLSQHRREHLVHTDFFTNTLSFHGSGEGDRNTMVMLIVTPGVHMYDKSFLSSG